MDTRYGPVGDPADGQTGPAYVGQALALADPGDAPPLTVNEIFGPTVQGEGPATGRHCLFVRLALCNLRCRWCDTAYTWAFTEELAAHLDRPRVYDRAENARMMSVGEVLDGLRAVWDIDTRPTTVVISGGEPLMQPGLDALAAELAARGNAVHVETAGTIVPSGPLMRLVELFVVSPKLAHSGNPERKRLKALPLTTFAAMGHQAVFKFVVTGVEDLPEVDGIVTGMAIPACRVMIMPEGTTVGALLATGREIADHVTARGWGLSLRSHILLWSDERGR
jgi:7-carboxy-7-deazaguanine synthase